MLRAGAAEGAGVSRELFRAGVRHKHMNTHASAPALPLSEEPSSQGRVFLNASVWFVDSDGYRVVFRWHEPLYRVALNDKPHLRQVAVALRQSGLATQAEICRAFGHAPSTQARWEQQFRKFGLHGLLDKQPTGRRPDLNHGQEACIRRWFRAGCSNRKMARRLAVDEATIRRALKRLRLRRKPAMLPQSLPGIDAQPPQPAADAAPVSAPAAAVESPCDLHAEPPLPAAVPAALAPQPCGPEAGVAVAPSAAASFTIDHDPRDRSGDRLLARKGLLEDAQGPQTAGGTVYTPTAKNRRGVA